MDKKMDNLLQRLKAGSLATTQIPWPGRDEEDTIQLRVLNDQDYLTATLSADKIIPNVTVANVSKYNGELETQLLHRVITDPETGRNIGNITEFRQLLTPEIKVILVDELDALHDLHSPKPNTLDDDEFDQLVDAVKKKPDQTLSSVSSIHTLRKLVKYLVSPLVK